MPVPVIGSDSGARESGVYRFLAEREETEYQEWLASVHGRNGQYPRRLRLAALRAGRPVVFAVYELPAPARPAGTLPAPKSRLEWSREYDVAVGRFVTVHSDDRVVSGAADGAPTPLEEYLDL